MRGETTVVSRELLVVRRPRPREHRHKPADVVREFGPGLYIGERDADPPPLRVFFGTAPLGIAENDYEGRLATWREWQPVAELAQGDAQ